MKYYVTHEMGHLVDGLVEKNDPKKRLLLDKLFGDQINPKHRSVKFDPEKGGSVSQYGRTDVNEAFAKSLRRRCWTKKPENPIIKMFKEQLGL